MKARVTPGRGLMISAALCLFALILLAGCGSGGSSTSSQTTSGEEGTSSASAETSKEGEGEGASGETVAAGEGKGPTLPSGPLKCEATPTGDNPCLMPAAPPEGDPVKIMFSYWENNTYSEAGYEAAKKTAEEYGATVEGVTYNSANPNEQVSQIQDAISSDAYDGYIVEPGNPPALRALLTQAISQGKPVSSFTLINGTDNKTSKIQLPGQTLQIAKPPFNDGENMGEMVVDACKGVDPCEVAFLRGIASIPFDQARYEGFVKVVSAVPSINVVAVGFSEYSIAGGQKATQDILQAHPNVEVIASLADQGAHGAEDAVKAAGKTGQVKITGSGGSTYGVAAVRDGRWYGDTLLLPGSEGVAAAISTIAAARGEQTELGVNSGLMSVDIPEFMDQANKSDWPPASFKGQWSGA